MKLTNIACIGATLASALLLSPRLMAAENEADPWLHIYYNASKNNSVLSMPMGQSSVHFNPESGTMTAGEDAVSVNLSDVKKWSIGAQVPRLEIETTPYIYEVTSKTTYVDGLLRLSTYGRYKDRDSVVVKLRGRGNSTWNWPKKPYRIKFNEKVKLCGFKKAKNYVLLANYMDYTLMRNAVAFTFGKVIGMPWCNDVEPVDVYLNGSYKGSYTLTQKVGINAGSVDLTKEEEAVAALYELDTTGFDEDDYEFKSDAWGIPVGIKAPDAPADSTGLKGEWLRERYDWFNRMEDAVYEGTEDMWNYLDLESAVRYIMMFNLSCNQELNHPKSAYMYTIGGDKFCFGPAWDFDWAYGYSPIFSKGGNTGWGGGWGWGGTVYQSYENPLLQNRTYNSGAVSYGGDFFLSIVKTQTFLNRYAEVWQDFYENHLDEFWDAFDAYERLLQPSNALDKTVLHYSSTYHEHLKTADLLREWVGNRIEYINNPDNNYGLFE